MSKRDYKALNIDGINMLLEELSKDNFILENYDAVLGNRISDILGANDKLKLIVNARSPNEPGSDLLLVLMYQNLLLARRVAKLEEINSNYY